MDNNKNGPERINLRIFDQSDSAHVISVEILTKVLQGLQKAIFAIAKGEEERPLKANVSKEFKQRFGIRCGIPKPGSYVLPVEFGEDASLNSVKEVSKTFWAYLDALNKEDSNGFNAIMTRPVRRQILSAFRDAFPKAGAKWHLGISRNGFDTELRYSSKTGKTIRRFTEELFQLDGAVLQTVTGNLVTMKFEERCIVLKYPPTGTELECFYNDELEATLFESRRELLQVTGNVTYESDRETPKKISDVEDIQVLDLSEFTLEDFAVDGREYRFNKPLVLVPELSESCQFMEIREPNLGIDVVAQTREELFEELTAEIEILWRTCATQPDEKLGRIFREQKQNLLAAITEVK